MTPQDAYSVLYETTGTLQLTRLEHIKIQLALDVFAKLMEVPTVQPMPVKTKEGKTQ